MYVAVSVPPTGNLAHNPGMCPDGNRTGAPWVCMCMLNALSYTSQSKFFKILLKFVVITFTRYELDN